MKAGRNSDLVWLNHIAECIAEIEAYTEHEKARFEGSRLVQRAVERVLQTLAESTQRLSKEIKATEPHMPWEEIAGFRNAIVHGYLHIDKEIVWDIVENDLPRLAAAIERMTREAST